MNIQVCSRCGHVNPPQALYCHFDGLALGNGGTRGPLDSGSSLFASPLVFPSGRSCHNFDELVLAAEDHWGEALQLLRQGFLAGFLGGVGRGDLAYAALQAKDSPDPDRALEELLRRLPSSARQPPRLHIQPPEFNLGIVQRGEQRRIFLVIHNEGMGLLHGSVASVDTPWLVLGDPPGLSTKMFECRGELIVPIQVLGDQLRAGDKAGEGALLIESNGGSLRIPVRAERTSQAFPEGVLAGATTPRQLAEKARANPKEAVPLFEKGAVRAWYEANGWSYPIQGPQAQGLAAIQQFFEALGLVQVPRVHVSDLFVKFGGKPGDVLEHTLKAMTPENRPIYAFARSELPWLKVGPAVGAGKLLKIQLTATVPDRPGESLLGKLEVQINGGKRIVVAVSLAVSGQRRSGAGAITVLEAGPLEAYGVEMLEASEVSVLPPEPPPAPSESLTEFLLEKVEEEPTLPAPPPTKRCQDPFLPQKTLAPAAPAPPAPPPARIPTEVSSLDDPERNGAPEPVAEDRPLSRPRRSTVARFDWRHLFGPGVIFLLLVFTLIHDSQLPAYRPPPGPPPPPPTKRLTLLSPDPLIAVQLHDGPQKVRPEVMPRPTMRFGVVLTREKDPADPTRPRRLTFDEWGRTNNTCLRVDGEEVLFGEAPGSWVETRRPHPPDPDTKREVNGADTVWRFGPLDVTQTVEIVGGRQSRLLDTCLVRYTLVNRAPKGTASLRVGLRVLLDTHVGAVDGVPFTLPGRPVLCDSRHSFDTPEAVPDFIEALERDTLRTPGTVLRLNLRVGKGMEAPGRVYVGGYPAADLAKFGHPRAKNQQTGWEVPAVSMRELYQRVQELLKEKKIEPKEAARVTPNSAVTLYWPERQLEPGRRREVGFALGLGQVTSDPVGKLLTSVGGRFVPGGEFTLTALVSEPKDEVLTLKLPPGVKLLPGSATEQPVPPLPAEAPRKTGVVTWRLQAVEAGTHALRVQGSSGALVELPVLIHEAGTDDGLFD
jgi:hypothetical protein